MVLIFKKMKELLPSLNSRPITWSMIRRACNKIGALIFNVPLRLGGYFIPNNLSDSGKPEIYVNSRLPEPIQIATAVHEIKHAVFDFERREMLFSYRQNWTAAARRKLDDYHRFEYEACAMGAIALLPEKKLKFASLGLFEPEDEFFDDVWRIRFDTRAGFGL